MGSNIFSYVHSVLSFILSLQETKPQTIHNVPKVSTGMPEKRSDKPKQLKNHYRSETVEAVEISQFSLCTGTELPVQRPLGSLVSIWRTSCPPAQHCQSCQDPLGESWSCCRQWINELTSRDTFQFYDFLYSSLVWRGGKFIFCLSINVPNHLVTLLAW